MRKSNVVTLLSFIFLLGAVVFVLFFWRVPGAAAGAEKGDAPAGSGVILVPPSETEADPPEDGAAGADKTETQGKPIETETAVTLPADVSMDDALFIGDSRTVGLQEYAGIEGADFFANVGMSVYNIHKKPVSVPSVGKVTLRELLEHKKYGKIYIMLGINEVGYRLDSTVDKYRELLEFIRQREPEAKLLIQANLHVTKSRSDRDEVVNNAAIDRLNAALAKLADGRHIFYLDANALFDDENGCLSSDKSEDGTHLYAKYYAAWGSWIVGQTASLMEEGRS
ncbi:MAG: GDSL-type esterase/lipase family protein [Oscillospiraceae bacterium]